MRLPFLDRRVVLSRLHGALERPAGNLVCVYGRRRLGKSRLIQRALEGRRAVYYVGDARDAPLQRTALAREIDAVLPDFSAVVYPDWEVLLARFWAEADRDVVLALDELPELVRVSPELPSLLQKLLDRTPRHFVVCGSAQRMMHGLVLDATAPLYGRAREIIKLEPMGPRTLAEALELQEPRTILDHWATWGGVPRYWELAADYERREAALRELVLDPLGVLHREPERLLLDDVQDVVRSASLLSLIGQGCHRISEIAGRLGLPATSLTRPLGRLLDLGLVRRDIPFGRTVRDTRRTLYRIADPFLRLVFRFVEPNRSRLSAGQIVPVERQIRSAWSQYLGEAWEELARASVAHLNIGGHSWEPAATWWGKDAQGAPLELDVVARSSVEPERILVGEAKLGGSVRAMRAWKASVPRLSELPAFRGKRLEPVLFTATTPTRTDADLVTVDARSVIAALE